MKITQPYHECPRYDRCSVNSCPLDPEQDRHASDPGDKDAKCTIAKTIRVKIGSKYPSELRRGGLTAREYSSKMNWDKLPAEVKEAKKEAIKSHLEAYNRQNKG